MGKWCLHASSFIFDRIIIKVAGNQDRHKSSDEFDLGPLVSMTHLYVFLKWDLPWHIGLRWAIVALWATCFIIVSVYLTIVFRIKCESWSKNVGKVGKLETSYTFFGLISQTFYTLFAFNSVDPDLTAENQSELGLHCLPFLSKT